MGESLRNPSPPPLTDEEKKIVNADFIGDTVFSKKWVLKTLLTLLAHKEDEIYESMVTKDEKEDQCVKEIKSSFEDEVCELWDISANSDVAVFLYENQGKDTFLHVLDKTQSPRLLEICFGILGNMSCEESVSNRLSNEESFRETLLDYLGVTDSLSLVELTRLLCVLISHDSSLKLWIETFKNSSAEPGPVEQLVDILENSLNVSILTNIIEILDILFDNSEELMEENCDRILSMFVAVYSTLSKNGQHESISNFLHMLQSLTTTVTCVAVLSKHENLAKFLCDQFNNILSGENPRVKDQCLQSFYSVINCLLANNASLVLGEINTRYELLIFLIDILLEKLSEYNTNENAELNHIYLMVYLEPFVDICHRLTQEEASPFKNLVIVLKEKRANIQTMIGLCSAIGQQSSDFKLFGENLKTFNENLGVITPAPVAKAATKS